MNIIFDYNRTLFDPDNNKLYDGVLELLESLYKDHKLYLFTLNESGREEFFRNLSIDKFFSKIAFVDEKNEENISSLTKNETNKKIIVIGDSLRDEIYLGNKLGYETIWLKQGKFADQTPRNKLEIPKKVILSIKEIQSLIDQYKKNN